MVVTAFFVQRSKLQPNSIDGSGFMMCLRRSRFENGMIKNKGGDFFMFSEVRRMEQNVAENIIS